MVVVARKQPQKGLATILGTRQMVSVFPYGNQSLVEDPPEDGLVQFNGNDDEPNLVVVSWTGKSGVDHNLITLQRI